MTGSLANDPDLAPKLAKIFGNAGPQDLIANLDAKVDTLTIGNRAVPITRSNTATCDVCGPVASVIDTKLQETGSKRKRNAAVRAMKPVLRASRLDRQVQPNNWLLPINLVPELTEQDALTLRDTLTTSDKDGAIVIRSLNSVTDRQTMAAFGAAGFGLLPVQKTYIIEHPTPSKEQSKTKLIDALTFSAHDFTQAAVLLALASPDSKSARYTPRYLAQAHQIGLLQIKGIRAPDDMLTGVIALIEDTRTVSVPLIGHALDAAECVTLLQAAIAHAARQNKVLNLGPGNGDLKQSLGAVPVTDHSAAYVAHLGAGARLATGMTKRLMKWGSDAKP